MQIVYKQNLWELPPMAFSTVLHRTVMKDGAQELYIAGYTCVVRWHYGIKIADMSDSTITHAACFACTNHSGTRPYKSLVLFNESLADAKNIINLVNKITSRQLNANNYLVFIGKFWAIHLPFCSLHSHFRKRFYGAITRNSFYLRHRDVTEIIGEKFGKSRPVE